MPIKEIYECHSEVGTGERIDGKRREGKRQEEREVEVRDVKEREGLLKRGKKTKVGKELHGQWSLGGTSSIKSD